MSMLLAVDLGNSSAKFGVFENENLISKFSTATARDLSAGEFYSQISTHLNYEISAVIISSVVPELEGIFREMSVKISGAEPVFVNHTFDFGLQIKYFPFESLGADRIVAAFAAVEKYSVPAIVCDFGTATTIDAVNSKREYLGGVIAPGISTFSEALFQKTSRLPKVEIEKPEAVIGSSTAGSIQSGIYFGYSGLVEGILRRMIVELGERPKIVATGGFAALAAGEVNLIEVFDDDLILDGLRMLYSGLEK